MAEVSCVMSLEIGSCLWLIFLGEPIPGCGCLLEVHGLSKVGCTGGSWCPEFSEFHLSLSGLVVGGVCGGVLCLYLSEWGGQG